MRGRGGALREQSNPNLTARGYVTNNPVAGHFAVIWAFNVVSFLYNTLSEVNFRGRAGVKPGGSGRCGPVVDDTDDLIDGERDDAEH